MDCPGTTAGLQFRRRLSTIRSTWTSLSHVVFSHFFLLIEQCAPLEHDSSEVHWLQSSFFALSFAMKGISGDCFIFDTTTSFFLSCACLRSLIFQSICDQYFQSCRTLWLSAIFLIRILGRLISLNETRLSQLTKWQRLSMSFCSVSFVFPLTSLTRTSSACRSATQCSASQPSQPLCLGRRWFWRRRRSCDRSVFSWSSSVICPFLLNSELKIFMRPCAIWESRILKFIQVLSNTDAASSKSWIEFDWSISDRSEVVVGGLPLFGRVQLDVRAGCPSCAVHGWSKMIGK